MDCHDAQPQMTAYLSGDLVLEDRRTVEAHLSACECCRVELARLGQVWEALAGLPVMPLDPTADRQVLERVVAEIAGEPMTLSVAVRWRGIAVAALLAAALSIGNSIFLPYEVAFQWCSRTLRAYALFADLSDTGFFFVTGIFYGLIPLLVVGLVSGRILRARPLFHGTAASLAFTVLTLPYVIIVCSALPGLFTLSLIGGITLGALSGGLGGFWTGTQRWRLAH